MTKQLTNTELIFFCRQLALILKSGISLLEGVSILRDDAASKEGQEILTSVYDRLLETGSITDALTEAHVFPAYLIHMVEIGDISGNLEEAFSSLADHYQREEDFSKNIRSALSYPLIMLGMLSVVLLVLILKVMPVFNQVFMELGAEMSGLSLHILNLGNTLRRYSLVFLLLLAALVGGLFYLFRSPRGKQFLAGLPFTKSLSEKIACARFASGLSMALRSGLDTEGSFDLVIQLIENPSFQEKVSQARSLIQEGEDFAESLNKAGIFSGMDARMVSMGFRTGSADMVLGQIADRLFEETDDSLQRAAGLVEPTLVAVLSVLVGLILLSVMLPLVGIMSNIG